MKKKSFLRMLVKPFGCVFSMALFIHPALAFSSDFSASNSNSTATRTDQLVKNTDLPEGHRYIKGTVEAINENSIKVDAGEAGEMSPRYLNLETQEDEQVKIGDRLQIEVNGQNKVVRYQRIETESK